MTDATSRDHDATEPDWAWADGDTNGWVPPDADTTRPSAARMYDVALGGKDNFAVDRAAVARIAELLPDVAYLATANRRFLVHATHSMALAGVDQFLDLGTGIPVAPGVHEVAHAVVPAARVVYVDHDALVVAQNRALRESAPGVVAVHHDLRDPQAVLGDPAVKSVLDLDHPVGLLMLSVLHFVRRDIAADVVAAYRRALAPGSLLAISVLSADGTDPALVARLEEVYAATTTPIVLPSTAEIEQLFEGFQLLEPGLVDVRDWRPDGPRRTRRASGVSLLAGLARKV